MGTIEILVVCKCPICCRTYRQAVQHRWIGKTYRPRAYEMALAALCAENRQTDGRKVWAGLAYCSECSIRRAPEALRETLRAWLTKGEYL